jgi:hypothetical protein
MHDLKYFVRSFYFSPYGRNGTMTLNYSIRAGRAWVGRPRGRDPADMGPWPADACSPAYFAVWNVWKIRENGVTTLPARRRDASASSGHERGGTSVVPYRFLPQTRPVFDGGTFDLTWSCIRHKTLSRPTEPSFCFFDHAPQQSWSRLGVLSHCCGAEW